MLPICTLWVTFDVLVDFFSFIYCSPACWCMYHSSFIITQPLFWMFLFPGFSFVLPPINNIFLLRASETHGTYLVIKGLFMVKVVLGILLFCAGRTNLIVLSFFLARYCFDFGYFWLIAEVHFRIFFIQGYPRSGQLSFLQAGRHIISN